jgi:hypothetical protein
MGRTTGVRFPAEEERLFLYATASREVLAFTQSSLQWV